MQLGTHPFVADELLVADGLVGLELGGRTGGSESVTKRFRAASVVVPAFVPELERALIRAAGTLKRKQQQINKGN